MPTEFGSSMYEGHRPALDSSAVAILRAAGALIFGPSSFRRLFSFTLWSCTDHILIGKTTTSEFTVANSGPKTTNPHDPRRTPGGSSCGSAAAVADFQVPISLGSQTGGSIIRPASFTGIFAMKPTHNAISPEGQKAVSPTFDTFGFFARNLEDLQLVADVFALRGGEVPRSIRLGGFSVGLIRSPFWAQAGPGTVAAMEKAATILQRDGVKVTEVSLPVEMGDLQALLHAQKLIMGGESRISFLREYRMDKTKLGPEVRSLVENGAKFSNKEMVRALDEYARMRSTMDDLLANYSAIITPSAVDEAPLGLDDMGSAVFNTMWTASCSPAASCLIIMYPTKRFQGLHMPVINMPAFSGAHGMPIGISLVAGRFCDQHLLNACRVLSESLLQVATVSPE